MDIRTTDNRAVRATGRVLTRLNDRHPWSHNDHFHRWVLRRLPAQRERALDVGCGRGELLALLAGRFAAVRGTDRDEEMRAATAARCAALGNVSVGAEQLAELSGPYDLVTMIAVLHHLDTEPALAEVRRLLAPGGRLLVVGLARAVTPRDQVWDVASALANPVIGLAKHPRAAPAPPGPPPFPVRDPETSFDDVRSVAERVLRGVRMRRRLCFRYTLAWRAPG